MGQRGCNQEGDESDKGCVTIQGHNAVGSVAGWWPPLRLLNTDRRGPTGGCQRMRARWTYLSSRLGVWRIPVCDKHQTAIRCAREGVLSRIGAPGAFGACACTEGCPRRREDTPDWPLMKRDGAKTKNGDTRMSSCLRRCSSSTTGSMWNGRRRIYPDRCAPVAGSLPLSRCCEGA